MTRSKLSTFPGQLVAFPFGCEEGGPMVRNRGLGQQEYCSKPGNENSTITVSN